MAQKSYKKKKRIFLDHASTTPVDTVVLKAMVPFFSQSFANPSAIYGEGVEVKRVLDRSRKIVSDILGAHSDEIIFTGSGTESANLALLGIVDALKGEYKKPHIVVSPFEHPAILEAAKVFELSGGLVTYLPMYEDGQVKASDVRDVLTKDTVLVSIMYANNEIGTIQPIRDIAKTIRAFRKSKRNNNAFPYFHTDASQAANYLPLAVPQLGVDLLTLDGSKIYGPKGVGVLYVRRGVPIVPRIVGGGQEGGRRAGTENVPGIVGIAEALRIVDTTRDIESTRLTQLRDSLIASILKNVSNAHLNGSHDNRLPNNVNICFPGKDAEFLVLQLDNYGIAASSSSSCKNISDDTRSYVVSSLGKKGCDESSLRISLGRSTQKGDVQEFLKVLKKII